LVWLLQWNQLDKIKFFRFPNTIFLSKKMLVEFNLYFIFSKIHPIETFQIIFDNIHSKMSENENIYEIEHEGMKKYFYDPEGPINSEAPHETKKDGVCTNFMIFCFYSCLLNCFIGIFSFVVACYISYYAISMYPTVEFSNYEVIYDSFFGRPVSSTQKKIGSPSYAKYKDHEISRIKQIDYYNLSDKSYQKGLLSPGKSLDAEAYNILNIIPQLACHNAGVWRLFEDFVDKNYIKQGKHVTTVAKYGYFFWGNYLNVPNGKLYIPSQLCKILDGVEYCMLHDKSVCGKPWCKLINPPLNCELNFSLDPEFQFH
jgi:hypothetical protein